MMHNFICIDSNGGLDEDMEDYFYEGLEKDRKALEDCPFNPGDRVRLIKLEKNIARICGLRVGDVGVFNGVVVFEPHVTANVTWDHDEEKLHYFGILVSDLELE